MDSVRWLGECGCERAEIRFDFPDYFQPADPLQISELTKSLAQNGVRVQSVHAQMHGGTDFTQLDEHDRKAAVALQKRDMSLAVDLGARVMVFHPGAHGGPDRREEHLKAARRSVAELSDFASRIGLKMAVENMLGDQLGNTAGEILEIISDADPDWCGVCLDTGHAHTHSLLYEMAETLLPRCYATHFHDNDGLSDLHLFPGEGTIDWRRLGEIFRKTDCGAWLMIESNRGDFTSWEQAEARFLQLTGLVNGSGG